MALLGQSPKFGYQSMSAFWEWILCRTVGTPGPRCLLKLWEGQAGTGMCVHVCLGRGL